jgi:high-affinity Fe2+/Pb2+ permease
MSPTWIFLLDVTLTVFVCVGIVLYVAKHLRSLLIELCGTVERASFWLAFSNVSLVIVPLIFALDYSPEFGLNQTLVFEIAGQLKHALIGLITTFGCLALVLFWFVPREKPRASAHTAS